MKNSGLLCLVVLFGCHGCSKGVTTFIDAMSSKPPDRQVSDRAPGGDVTPHPDGEPASPKDGHPPGKRVFITSSLHTGKLGGLQGGDAICNDLARAASLGGTWKAWLSSTEAGTSSAIDRIADVGPWYLVNGAKAFNDKASLLAGPLTSLFVDEGGFSHQYSTVWTGTGHDGKVAAYHCQSWSSDSNTLEGEFGYAYVSGQAWTDNGFANCAEQANHLYCFEQ